MKNKAFNEPIKFEEIVMVMINIDIVFNRKQTNAWHLELYGYLKYSSLNYLFEFRVIRRIIVV